MPTRFTFKIDYPGVGKVLRGEEMSKFILGVSEEVAKNVDSQKLLATSGWQKYDEPQEIIGTPGIEQKVTDRVRGYVIILHPAAESMQAKYGVLTKAAAQAGLEVVEK